LGTEFSVRALPDAGDVEVIVASGSVALGRRGETASEAVLVAGQLGRLTSSGAVAVTRVADVALRLGWTEGRLSLDDIMLRDAVRELERWFDAEIRIADSALATRRLTTILGDQSLPSALDAIALALDARWERAGDTVVIRRK
jgi:ferric-dicitrate binding protein FerR (iron transport regulator)